MFNRDHFIILSCVYASYSSTMAATMFSVPILLIICVFRVMALNNQPLITGEIPFAQRQNQPEENKRCIIMCNLAVAPHAYSCFWKNPLWMCPFVTREQMRLAETNDPKGLMYLRRRQGRQLKIATILL